MAIERGAYGCKPLPRLLDDHRNQSIHGIHRAMNLGR
jgi:hypothetical protein